jgi:hypothetical protein
MTLALIQEYESMVFHAGQVDEEQRPGYLFFSLFPKCALNESSSRKVFMHDVSARLINSDDTSTLTYSP